MLSKFLICCKHTKIVMLGSLKMNFLHLLSNFQSNVVSSFGGKVNLETANSDTPCLLQ